MPIYEYACARGHEFEELIVRAGDEADVACRTCGSRDVTRRISRPAASPAGGRGVAPGRACGPVG